MFYSDRQRRWFFGTHPDNIGGSTNDRREGTESGSESPDPFKDMFPSNKDRERRLAADTGSTDSDAAEAKLAQFHRQAEAHLEQKKAMFYNGLYNSVDDHDVSSNPNGKGTAESAQYAQGGSVTSREPHPFDLRPTRAEFLEQERKIEEEQRRKEAEQRKKESEDARRWLNPTDEEKQEEQKKRLKEQQEYLEKKFGLILGVMTKDEHGMPSLGYYEIKVVPKDGVDEAKRKFYAVAENRGAPFDKEVVKLGETGLYLMYKINPKIGHTWEFNSSDLYNRLQDVYRRIRNLARREKGRPTTPTR